MLSEKNCRLKPDEQPLITSMLSQHKVLSYSISYDEIGIMHHHASGNPKITTEMLK